MKRLFLSLLCLVAYACSSATVYRHNAPDLETTILGGSATHIYVETEDGRIVRIPRKNITDVDHPGNIEAVIGGVIALTGGMLFAVGNTSNQPEVRVVFTALGTIYAVPGIILLADGLINWNRSNSAFDDRRTNLPVLKRTELAPSAGELTTPATSDYAIPVTLPRVPTLTAPTSSP